MHCPQDLLAKLVSYQSLTPIDAGCQLYMMNYLRQIGFTCQILDNYPVNNFFAYLGAASPLLLFAGHTDVVAAGELAAWDSDPFVLTQRDHRLYARGSADMKGGLACMLDAVARFVKDYPTFAGGLGFLITSGEEGDAFHLGTPYVLEQLSNDGIRPTYCIVGEPSSETIVGDAIKIGRRGSLSADIVVHGKQGHVAFPHLAINPIHILSPVLHELTTMIWDHGNQYFPPTSMQITQLQAGGLGSNVIPGQIILQLNWRFSTEQTAASLQENVARCFERHNLMPEITWRLNGNPYLTTYGELLKQTVNAIVEITGKKPMLTTNGGTSDGRFIAACGIEVIELGMRYSTIHQANECIDATDLQMLSNIYYLICKKLIL
ncbi:MAG: succinyl-diaminopimelate desuccinylase [Legionellales bacterium RIFCSPHIGHO2_12_FULL_42_9]|nr:MAG: succinyl-diaminopimelate desuccinylase [Legionellales bacterium RIFCSPHIGHO2_12_FULL_42_9]